MGGGGEGGGGSGEEKQKNQQNGSDISEGLNGDLALIMAVDG